MAWVSQTGTGLPQNPPSHIPTWRSCSDKAHPHCRLLGALLSFIGFRLFETGSHWLVQADLDLKVILSSRPPKYSDYRQDPPCPA